MSSRSLSFSLQCRPRFHDFPFPFPASNHNQIHNCSSAASSLVPLLFFPAVAMSTEQEAREDGCFAVTYERKYYHRGGAFIKKSLRPKEFRTGYRGLHVPRLNKESLMNEAESLRYIRRNT